MNRSKRDDSDNFDSASENEFGPKSRREREREHLKSKNKPGRPSRNVDDSDESDTLEVGKIDPKKRDGKNRHKWRDSASTMTTSTSTTKTSDAVGATGIQRTGVVGSESRRDFRARSLCQDCELQPHPSPNRRLVPCR